MSSHPPEPTGQSGGARAVLVARDLAQHLLPDLYRVGREVWATLQQDHRAWRASPQYAAASARAHLRTFWRPPTPSSSYEPYVHPMNMQVVPYQPLYPSRVLPHALREVPSYRSMRMRIAHTPVPAELPNYRSLRKEAKQLGEVAQRVKKRYRRGWKRDFQFMPLPALGRPYRYWPYHDQRDIMSYGLRPG